MAQAFLRGLPWIPSYTLPSDVNCPICIQPYENQTSDSGSFEKAVRLPCNENHIFGSECLSEWLQHGLTCPLCRCEITPPNAASDGRRMGKSSYEKFFNFRRNQEWEDYWYVTFWILHLQQGNRAVERKWRRWRRDWIASAERWDQGSKAHARAALSCSPPQLTPRRLRDDAFQVRFTAAAIQTLRFREYRLFLQFQADGAERPELRCPPGFQLTPAQEDVLFRELERRDVFGITAVRLNVISKREQWNKLRDVGFVWEPEWEVSGSSRRGRWTRYPY